ncbi:ribonuclease HII [Pyrodictium occultum]|uniref:Ribonuclease HII n=1 Tax=Pyrodictium occultum TaxID=2309 RepID=A0A0V8RXB3_PYROC|nr:ribonuclease HII [Pyrodictium occultum]
MGRRSPRGRLIAGVDEAGRGPVIGPMVVAGVVVDEASLERLAELGVRDSKELSPVQRRRLLPEILRLAKYVVVVKLPPALIDMVNLNRLELETIAYILGRVRSVLGRVDAVYLDAVGPVDKMVSEIRRLTGLGAPIVAEPRADAKYPAVSAASIVAKVARDEEIERLRRLYGVRGSGYPTDPETLEWIREAYRRSPSQPPWFVRRSWSTLRRVAPGWYRAKSQTSTAQGRRRSLLDYLEGSSARN